MQTLAEKSEGLPAHLQPSVLARLFEPVPNPKVTGKYDPRTQTWSHREAIQFSPAKHNQEM